MYCVLMVSCPRSCAGKVLSKANWIGDSDAYQTFWAHFLKEWIKIRKASRRQKRAIPATLAMRTSEKALFPRQLSPNLIRCVPLTPSGVFWMLPGGVGFDIELRGKRLQDFVISCYIDADGNSGDRRAVDAALRILKASTCTSGSMARCTAYKNRLKNITFVRGRAGMIRHLNRLMRKLPSKRVV